MIQSYQIADEIYLKLLCVHRLLLVRILLYVTSYYNISIRSYTVFKNADSICLTYSYSTLQWLIFLKFSYISKMVSHARWEVIACWVYVYVSNVEHLTDYVRLILYSSLLIKQFVDGDSSVLKHEGFIFGQLIHILHFLAIRISVLWSFLNCDVRIYFSINIS